MLEWGSMKRRFFVGWALLATCIALAGGSVRSLPIEDEQIPSPHAATPGLHGIEMNEVAGLRDNVSVLVGSGGTRICTSVADSACGTNSSFYFRAVLGPCATSEAVDCIESVTAIQNSITEKGTFSRYFPNHGVTDFVGSSEIGVPDGVAPGLWNFPSVPHAFGSTYQVTVLIAGSSANGNSLNSSRSFFANITPVSVFQTNCSVQSNGHCMDTYYEGSNNGMPAVRFAGVAADQDGGFRCQNWGENSQCALKHAFPEGVRFVLNVRLRKSPNGWLHGRMSDPSASIASTSSGAVSLSVEAAPVKVPVVAKSVAWSSLPASLQPFFETCSTCGSRQPVNDLSNPATRNLVSTPPAFKSTSFEQLELWKSFINDSAYAMPSVWNVRTLSESEMSSAPSCISKGQGITGIVSTNATLYAEGPPSYDSVKGALNYKVSAPHFQKDGTTPFLGYYGLLLREDIAECLYGAPNFGSTGSVVVQDADGTLKSATSAFSQSGGWFRFVASGYTHSAPRISAKLTPQWPSVRRGGKISAKTIARLYGFSIPKGATLAVSIASRSKSQCKASAGTSVLGLKKGPCSAIISIKPRATKTAPRPKTLKKAVTVIIK